MDPARRPAPVDESEDDHAVAAPASEADPDQRGKRKKAVPADKPGAGRSTRLGRKVETPASIKTAGPSGQKGGTQHQKKHTNK